jgi:hypothetical protein
MVHLVRFHHDIFPKLVTRWHDGASNMTFLPLRYNVPTCAVQFTMSTMLNMQDCCILGDDHRTQYCC